MRKDGAKSTNGRPAQWATKEKEPLAIDVDPPLQPPHANPDVVHGAEHVEGQENQDIERLTRTCGGKTHFSRIMLVPGTLAQAPAGTSCSR